MVLPCQGRRAKLFARMFMAYLSLFAGVPAFVAYAQPGPVPAPSVIRAVPVSDSEVSLLREQNKIIRDYQESILDTVYWALGALFVIAALLAGFGWWSNFKVYDKDKARLQEDLEAKVAQLEAELSLRIENSRGELVRVVTEKSEAHLNRLLAEASDLRNRVASTDSKVVGLNEAVGSLDASLKTSVKAIRQLISENAAELRQVEEHIWELKGVPSNILITQSQGILAARDAENPARVKSVLTRMKETIERHFISKDRALPRRLRVLIEPNIVGAQEIDSILATEVLDLLDRVQPEGELNGS